MPKVVTTEIKLKADDREAKKLKQTIQEAFDPSTAKGLNAATRDLGRTFSSAAKQQEQLIKQQAELEKQLSKIKKGSDAFKSMKSDLKAAKAEIASVTRELRFLQRESARVPGHGRNFVAGIAQGSGLMGYLPAGPGMGARMAGAGIGGFGRRIGRSMAAPFMMPGVGGLAQGLAGIPLVGGFAAGALQTGAAAFQSSVAYDRAKQANLYFANEDLGRRVYGTGKPSVAQLLRLKQAQERLEAAKSGTSSDAKASLAAWEKAHPAPLSVQAARGSVTGGAKYLASGGLEKTAEDVFRRAKGLPSKHTESIERLARWRHDRAATIEAQRTAETANAEGSVWAAEYAIKAAKQSKVAKGRLSGLGSSRTAVTLGYGPMQAEAMKGQFYQAAGGLFHQGEFNESLAATSRYGISSAQAGQYARLGRAGGGGTGLAGLAETLQGAFVQGLRGSQIPEYLSELVSIGQSSEKQGIKLNASDFEKLSMRLQASGIKGLQGSRIAGGLIRSGQALAARGVQSPMDMLMLRAAGYNPEQGPEGYWAAQERLESGDEGVMTSMISKLVQGTQGLGPAQRAGLIKRAFAARNTPIGMDQARALISAYESGEAPDISKLLAGRGAMGGAEGMLRSARGRVKSGAGLTLTAADLERQRIGTGYGFAFIAKFEQATLKSAGAISNFSTSLNKLGDAVKAAAQGMNDITKGGASGIAERIAKAVLGLGS